MTKFIPGMALLALCICCLCAAGCKSTSVVVGVETDVDFESIKRVGVVPFDNHSTDRLAGEKVTSIFLTAMSKFTSVEIIDPGEMLKALEELGAEKNKLSSILISKVGKKIGAEALIFGSVEEFSMEKFDNVVLPVVAVSARMVDVKNGKVLWVASASDSGMSRVPIINIGEIRTRTALATKVVTKMISRIYLR